jgi:hypothetical protein
MRTQQGSLRYRCYGSYGGDATVAVVYLYSNDHMDSYESRNSDNRDHKYDLMGVTAHLNKLAVVEEKSNDTLSTHNPQVLRNPISMSSYRESP